MKLIVKDVNLSTGGPYVAILNTEDAEKLDLNSLDRVRLTTDGRELVVFLDISKKGIKPGQIGLFEEVLKALKLRNNNLINVYHQKKPESIYLIRKKLSGDKLNGKEIEEIIKDVVVNKLSAVDLTYFVSACYTRELEDDEVLNLINAMIKYGGSLGIKQKMVLDKHCVGGVANNRTTMLVVPIIAAAGYTIIKTSSRSITSPSGTSDTMEVLSPVALNRDKIKKVVKKTNACIVWGGAIELASADDAFINIERVLSLDPEGMLLASILAKKKSVGSTHILIDIPVGVGAKFEDMKKARRLSKRFASIGKKLGMKVKAIITDGSQPVGNGIGPVLEARDVLAVLNGNGPEDLRNKALHMAELILEMAGAKDGKKLATEILDSGKALKKMRQIIKAQGGNPNITPERLVPGRHRHDVCAEKDCIIREINNKNISKLARIAGAPKDKAAGVYLHYHVGQRIKKGDVMFTVYTENKRKLEFVKDFLSKIKVIEAVENGFERKD